MKRITLIWAVLTAMALPVTALAQDPIYKWVDKDGLTHYSTHPPAGQKVEKVSIFSNRGEPSEPAAAATPAEPAPPRAAPPEATAGARPVIQKDPELCKQARQNLWNLENRSRIYILDQKTGERAAMPDEERQQRIEESRKDIGNYCD